MSNERYKVVMNCSEWEDPDTKQNVRVDVSSMDKKSLENLAIGLSIVAGLGITTMGLLFLFSRKKK
tara:strand:- start:396 stop:593 length:198 start_codon:yes stop_codon:yes gene_type:complete